MKRVFKIAALLFLAATLLLTGCAHNQSTDSEEKQNNDEVVIPVLFRMDGETEIQPNKALVDIFNERYAGTYRVEVEWFIGDEAGYRERIKLLNATDQLPAVFTDVGVLPDFYQLLVENDRLVNILPYMDADERWAVQFPEYILNECTEKDGAMYLVPITTPEYLAGIYYNKEIFSKAGIEIFPKTWDEFFEDCEAIKKLGYYPLGLHTTGTAWTTMLFSTAYLGRTQAGRDFLSMQYPANYDSPEMRDMLSAMKRFFDYAPAESIDGDYDEAFKDFLNEKVAMFPNGQWMIDELYDENLVSPDTVANLGFALFPENTAVGSVRGSGWVIAKNYPQEVIKGAVEFVKLRTSMEEQYMMNGLYINEEKPLMQTFYSEIAKAEIVVPNYQIKWNSIIQDEVLLIDLPQYLRDEISLDDFIEKMNQAVKRFEYERGT